VNFSKVRGPARGLNMASQPLWSFANAAASSRTSGFIKNVLYGGVTFTCTPSASSSAATIGPTAATTMRPYGRQWHSQNHSASLKALTALALYFPHWVLGGSHKARGSSLSFEALGTRCECHPRFGHVRQHLTAFVSSLVAGVLGSSQWVLTYGQGALNEVGIARRRWDRTCVCLLLSEPVGIGAACAVCSLDFRLAGVMAAAGSPAGCSVYR